MAAKAKAYKDPADMPLADRWIPVFNAWIRFTHAHQQLGLSSSMAAMRRFLAQHGQHLQERGVLAKVAGKVWLADVTRFNDAAFLTAIGRGDEVKPN